MNAYNKLIEYVHKNYDMSKVVTRKTRLKNGIIIEENGKEKALVYDFLRDRVLVYDIGG